MTSGIPKFPYSRYWRQLYGPSLGGGVSCAHRIADMGRLRQGTESVLNEERHGMHKEPSGAACLPAQPG